MGDILFALWFFLPAGLANTAPVAAKHIPYLKDFKTPLDFGKHWRNKRILGDNKTWRGLLFGIVIGVVVVWIQQLCYSNFHWAHQISQDVDYNALNPIILGSLFGAGALLGDAIESFFKRQAHVAPGESWFPFDQSDYILGALLASSLVVTLSLQQYVVIFVIWFCMHLLSVYVGYILGVRDKPI